MKKYSIKEISLAWDKFTRPIYLVNNKNTEIIDTRSGGAIFTDDLDSITTIQIDYAQWIPYLISEEWK